MSAEPSWEDWAKYYDLVDQDRKPFIDFYGSLVDTGVRAVLEVACGTGVVISGVADRLAQMHGSLAGIRLVGADEAPSMLSAARARDRRIEWIRADMRQRPVPGQFDLVICCYNTMQHMLEDGDFIRAATTVAGMLAERGRYAFDVYQPNPDYLSRSTTDHLARKVRDTQGRTLEIRESLQYDPAKRVLTIDWKLIEQGKSQTALARARYHYRQYSHDELVSLLARAGLQIDEVYGDFDRAPFTSASKKQIVVCTRAR